MELQFARGAPSARKFRVMVREKGLLGAVMETPVGADAGPVRLSQFRGPMLTDPIEIIFALDACGAGPRLLPEARSGRAAALKLLVLADEALERGTQLLAGTAVDAAALRAAIGEAERMAPKAEPLTIGGIAIATTLTWLDKALPAIGWKADAPALSALQAAMESRPSFQNVPMEGA